MQSLLAALRGDRAGTVAALERAEEAAAELRFDLRKAALQLLRGLLHETEGSRELAENARLKLSASGISDPLRWADHLYPGLLAHPSRTPP